MSSTTGDEAHEAFSPLPLSPPSSASSHSPPAQAYNDVSDAMLAEEKRMKQAGKSEDRNARNGGQKGWEDAPAEEKKQANEQLDYLINKAQVSRKGRPRLCRLHYVALNLAYLNHCLTSPTDLRRCYERQTSTQRRSCQGITSTRSGSNERPDSFQGSLSGKERRRQIYSWRNASGLGSRRQR